MLKISMAFACVLIAALASAVWAGDARQDGPRKDDAKDAPPSLPLSFKAPKDWQKLDPGPFSVARFQIGKGQQSASVSITILPGDGGGLAPNVNRWRGQVALGELPAEDALKTLQLIKIDGVEGHRVAITGPETDGKTTQGILAAILKRGEQTWFFKMSGPATLVEKQGPAFDGFLKSVRFEKKNGS